MRMSLWLAVLAAVALPAGAAANPGVSRSLPPDFSSVVSVPAHAADASAADVTLAPATLALAMPFPGGTGYGQRIYRPRVYPTRPQRAPMSVIPFCAQIHIGFFNPIDNFSTGFDGGFRIGPQMDPYIQIGLGMDWWRRSENTVLHLGNVRAPGSTASEELILSESTANLIPILAFVQVSGSENMPIIPYAGFGAGYEWLFLTADDFVTHESFDQTYGGFGWQIWAGAGLRIDPRMRLNGEVFFNGCDVGSDVDVDIPGYGPATVRDVINVNGLGMRLGASWQF